MKAPTYFVPRGGHPAQSELMTGRAIFTESYAVMPNGVMRDIVTSYLPYWERTRVWIVARPMTGFAETFSQYIMEVEPGGGSTTPEVDPGAEAAIFVLHGVIELTIRGERHRMEAGGFAYLPPSCPWSLLVVASSPARFIWVRKLYEPVAEISAPDPLVTNETLIVPDSMPGTDGRWATTRFVDPLDLRHDMHLNIVTLEPGATIPFEETHVMEHGIYVLEGKALYLLNKNWTEVEAGDFMWLRAFCPQACYAGGPGRFRYLLYKDVNRHAQLRLRSL